MKMKKYILPLLVIFAFLGIAHYQQCTTPNQEIVLQFKNINTQPNQEKNAVQAVEEALNNIGVKHFKVYKNTSGKLKILYFSKVNVAIVKRVLAKQISTIAALHSDTNTLPFEFPFDKNDISYHFDVLEITNNSKSKSGLAGIGSKKYRTKADRFSIPNVSAKSSREYQLQNTITIFGSKKLYTLLVIAKQNTLTQIPNVRAGPFLS